MSLAALPMAYTYADTIGNSSNTMNKESSVPMKTHDDMSTTHEKTTTSGTVHTLPMNDMNKNTDGMTTQEIKDNAAVPADTDAAKTQ